MALRARPSASRSLPFPIFPAHALAAHRIVWRCAAPVQDTAHVVIVATTDIHGHATDWDYVANRPFPGGLSRVATIVDSLKARYPGAGGGGGRRRC